MRGLLNKSHRPSNLQKEWEGEQGMRIPRIAAALSLVSALVSYGSAQSAPLTSLSAAVGPGAEQAGAVQVRWRRGWHGGGAGWGTLGAPPNYYGGSYFGYAYEVFPFPGVYCHGYIFPTAEYGCRLYGWYRRY